MPYFEKQPDEALIKLQRFAYQLQQDIDTQLSFIEERFDYLDDYLKKQEHIIEDIILQSENFRNYE